METVMEQLEHLARLMSERNVSRLEVQSGSTKLVLRRAQGETSTPLAEAMPPLFLSGYAETPPAEQEVPAPSGWQPPAPMEIRAPVVGYCTLAPLEIGTRLDRGQTLGTIEVLGIPTEVSVPQPCTLQAWLVENG
ncbi:MAG: hypothetical protein SNJ72_10630, partial [Fimbriimonadales bacterium]